MDQSEFRALLHRYQQGECTPVEAWRIEQWYKRLGADQPLGLTVDEQAVLLATVWQRIARETVTIPQSNAGGASAARFWPAMPMRWAAAALLGLALGGGLLITGAKRSLWSSVQTSGPAPDGAAAAPEWVVYANATARAARIKLPDGSAVTVAPASSLRYPRAFVGRRRTVYLTGDAFFDVFHDAAHPFSVYTDQVVTTVLGTSFRVRAFAGQPEAQVQVRTGAVQVRPRANEAPGASVVVRPNQQAVYSAARRQLRRELVAQPTLLAAQDFVFDDRPVVEVLQTLEKAYGVTVVYDAAALRSCTVNLRLSDEPLFAKLDLLCETLGATYEQADGRILFHNQPCQAE